MTLLFFLTGLSTVTSSAPTPPSSGVVQFGMGGPGVVDIFPVSTVISSYAPVTKPTNYA
jgi:hypothetical protein